MGHLSTLMWRKVHENQNMFTVLESKSFVKVKFIKAPAVGFEHMTNRFVANTLTHRNTMLGKNFR